MRLTPLLLPGLLTACASVQEAAPPAEETVTACIAREGGFEKIMAVATEVDTVLLDLRIKKLTPEEASCQDGSVPFALIAAYDPSRTKPVDVRLALARVKARLSE